MLAPGPIIKNIRQRTVGLIAYSAPGGWFSIGSPAPRCPRRLATRIVMMSTRRAGQVASPSARNRPPLNSHAMPCHAMPWRGGLGHRALAPRALRVSPRSRPACPNGRPRARRERRPRNTARLRPVRSESRCRAISGSCHAAAQRGPFEAAFSIRRVSAQRRRALRIALGD